MTAHIPNEHRADRGASAFTAWRGGHGWLDPTGYTDLTDMVADILHLAARMGHDPRSILERAEFTHAGDLEDGPEAKPGA